MLIDFVLPLTTALILLTFGFQVLFDLLCEWLTLIPKVTPLPQISHFAICEHLLFLIALSKQKYFNTYFGIMQVFFEKNFAHSKIFAENRRIYQKSIEINSHLVYNRLCISMS